MEDIEEFRKRDFTNPDTEKKIPEDSDLVEIDEDSCLIISLNNNKNDSKDSVGSVQIKINDETYDQNLILLVLA